MSHLIAHCAETAEGIHRPGGKAHAASARTVSGLVLPWDKVGGTSLGNLIMPRPQPGGNYVVRVPRDLSRCKLHLNHSGTPGHKVVGYATAAEYRPEGLHMTFKVAATPDGDAALADVLEHVRDAFSAELHGILRDGDTVNDSLLDGVALVDTPAFRDARVETVNAQFHNPITETERDTMNVKDFIRALIAAGATEAEARAKAVAIYGQDATDGVNADDLDFTPAGELDTPDTGETGAPAGETAAAQASFTPRAAVVPQGIPGTSAKNSVQLSLSEAADALRMVQAGRSGEVAHAALANITGSSMVDATPPQWLGELWDGREVPRRIIPLMGHRALKSWLIQGWRWNKKPLVGPYAGDKTEIPTNEVSIAPYESEATRWAGGHDLDRKFYDFGDRSVIEGYWRAMNNSYALVTDANAADWLVANASGTETASDLLRALITAQAQIEDSLNVNADYILANPAEKMKLLDGPTAAELPAYLSLFNVNLRNVVWTSRVPAGQVIAGCKPAAVHHELAGSPLRVEAEHLSHGGRDAALFGYTALTLDNPDGLVKVTFGGTAPTPTPAG